MTLGLDKKIIKAVIVGAGHRSLLYSSYALKHPEELKITGVVDPDDLRSKQAARLHNIPEECCFKSVNQLVSGHRIADAVINGTMDSDHVSTSLPLIKEGYDILLEKPIGISKQEVLELLDAARKFKRKIIVCHVLRYAPFYAEIRKRVAGGEIGEILSINTEENVSYHHMAAAYVRGKWCRRELCGSPMLMAKCCHDLDLITWMKSGIEPINVSSFGSLMYFRPDKAPAGSGTRCLADCKIERVCPYSAYKNYVEQNLWDFYAWKSIEHLGEKPSLEQKIESLRTDNPFGRCVWGCDNNVVDHQTVIIEYSDGCTSTHNMTGGVSKPCRTIHMIGTKGEIVGVMEDGFFTVRHPDARQNHVYSEERIEVNVSGDQHGGGDLLLVEDFMRVLRGEPASISNTALEDSIYGHLIGFSADRSMLEKRVVRIESLQKKHGEKTEKLNYTRGQC